MIVFEPREAINQWVSSKGGGYAHPGSFSSIGYVSGRELIGALVFFDCNKKNCCVNIALRDKTFPISLLRAGLLYTFHQLALKRLTFIVSSANLPSQTLVRQLGAVHEATLRDADPFGDSLIFALFPESCPIWSRFNGKILRGSPLRP